MYGNLTKKMNPTQSAEPELDLETEQAHVSMLGHCC